MKPLDQNTRRLLTQAAFAAVNHRLKRQIERLMAILPVLVEDENDRVLCYALMLHGLERDAQALAQIAGRDDAAANAVRALIGKANAVDEGKPVPGMAFAADTDTGPRRVGGQYAFQILGDSHGHRGR